MAYKIDSQYLQKFASAARKSGMSDDDIANHIQTNFGVQLGYTPKPVEREKTLTDTLVGLAPTAGSILGGIGGTLLAGGNPLGGIAGAGAGGALGETIRQAITPEDDTDLMKILGEGAWGAGGEALGIGAGKLLGKGVEWLGGKALPATAEAIATKNLGKPAVKAFAKTGGSLGEKMIQHEVVGKTSAEVAEKAAEELAKYESAIASSTKPISSAEIFDALMKQAQKFLGNANPSVHAKGEALQQIAEGTMNQFANKPLITPGELLVEKRLVSDVLAKGAYDEGVKKAVNTVHEDILRKILNTAVPEAEHLGKNQRDLIKIAEIVKNSEQAMQGGRALPWLPIATAGIGSAGGLPTMVGGYALGTALNSPAVTQGAANLATKAAPVVAKMGAGIGADTTANAFLRTLGGQGVTRGVAGLFGNNDLPATPTDTTGSPSEAVSTLAPELGGTTATTKAGGILDVMGLDEDKFLKAYMLNPSNKTLSAIYDAYKAENKTTKSKATNAQVNQIADIKNSYNMLDEAAKSIQSNPNLFGPVKGTLAKLNVYDPEAQTTNAQFDIIAQIMGKALEGGKLTDQDILRYRKMLPSITDTPKTALGKIAKVKRMIQLKEGSLDETMKSMQNLDVVGSTVSTE